VVVFCGEIAGGVLAIVFKDQVCLHVCVHMCVYVYMCVYAYVCVCLHHVCVYVYMSVCVHTCVCTFTFLGITNNL